MNRFGYDRPSDVAEAVRDGNARGVRCLAGGSNLVDLMKENVERPVRVGDINRLPLLGITATATELRLGALERMSDTAEHPAVMAGFPAVSQALLASASPQLRNMASLGGNVLQRTRCPYFRDPAFPCNKRVPGSGCPAQTGDNRTLAILGTSPACIATNPSDLAVALVALDAVLTLTGGAKGQPRQVPLTEFYKLPGTTPHLEHQLPPGELITAITLPQAAHARRSLYLKVRDRASYAYALVSAAVGLDVQAGVIRSARVALGGVGTVPWRAPAAEKMLVGQAPTEANFRAAAAAAVRGAAPREHNKFKVELAQRTLVRALTDVAALG